MCYQVECKQCGKSTWGGCGLHVASVYRSIEEGMHCTCHPWPGVGTGSGSVPPGKFSLVVAGLALVLIFYFSYSAF